MRVVLISTYELGRQPFGLASPAAWLRRAGCSVTCVDLTREPLPDGSVAAADLVAFYMPMHTATRLAVPVIARVQALNPAARLCAYGVYAPLNADYLREIGVAHVLGGEFEAELTSLAMGGRGDSGTGEPKASRPHVPRLEFIIPDRRGLLPPSRYASLQLAPGVRRAVGYTEASRGCKHLCRHCPIVPIYGGQFRVVPHEVVIEDIRAQVDAGAQHITFGDPDFFNGIGHAMTLVARVAREFPGLTYDVTVKIEHLLQQAAHLATLRDTGCLFVTSAVESIDEAVLAILEKGHTRADFERAVSLCRAADLLLSPTFVAFHPWTTLDRYCELLDLLASLELVEQVASIQLSIRLLIPEGSRLLERADVRAMVDPFDARTLAYPWRHVDPRVDRLQSSIAQLVGVRVSATRWEVFDAIRALAYEHACRRPLPLPSSLPRAAVPYLNEPWYC